MHEYRHVDLHIEKKILYIICWKVWILNNVWLKYTKGNGSFTTWNVKENSTFRIRSGDFNTPTDFPTKGLRLKHLIFLYIYI